jgi:hypothetical protein
MFTFSLCSILAEAVKEQGARLFGISGYDILANIIFGTIGMGSLAYGRKLELWKPQVIGIILMVYSYFMPNPYLLWGIGVGLLVLLWFHHDE